MDDFSPTTISCATACLLTMTSLAGMALRDHAASSGSKAIAILSPRALPPEEQMLVEFLLLLPVATLIIAAARVLIGLTTFGTFAPALLGLAFRDVHSLLGFWLLAAVLIVGWLARQALQHYRLLQVPRGALMLCVVICLLVMFVSVLNVMDLHASRYIGLLPVVVLAGVIERFWTLEEEEGGGASWWTLANTLVVAAIISMAVSSPSVVGQMMEYPETLGIVAALQFLLGRYTGYRLLELVRFRELHSPNVRTLTHYSHGQK